MNVIQFILNKFAKFQCFSINIIEVIKVLKTPKNAIFYVNHVSQKVLTSAPRGHVTMKFCKNVPR